MTTILGCSRAHRDLLDLVRHAAESDVEVLIQGPSGVGKELYARLIHEQGRRASAPFVPVNCGAVPAELFENELFGHRSGAFTGARERAAGLVEQAEGGTLFLDEVDSLTLASQVKLLRLLQEKEYRPLGDARTRTSHVRFIAATNADLIAALRAGTFRSDLFFRLRVLPLEVPSLHARPEDVMPLLEHFVSRYSGEYRLAAVRFTERARRRLEAYAWPGNVRELENLVRFLLCTRPGLEVDESELPLLPPDGEPDGPFIREGETFQAAKRRVVGELERTWVQEALERYDGNVAAAARASGKHRRAFFELMRRRGVTRSR